MDIHYNAFISYRHHPDDICVATQVHRALERYHIPKAVRKNQKGQLHLFRDKDELPITSNLSDNITLALENSDFLIVICSNHTKESLWVQREIETFLKTHSHDKVLTVLVDGEPYDTIPEILQYRDEVDPRTGEVTRVPVEPLSCDWRVGKKAAYREELPRLAAVLLGCSYDELRQRQRQYRLRRLMAVLSAATIASSCLMGYFLYTSIVIQQANVQIQTNLEEALRNQSRYLSSEALERYLAGDRLTAISLALAALPSQEDPRPYVPAAELTLTEALGIYDPYRGMTAAGIIECNALVELFAASPDGKSLYAADKTGCITFWDAENYIQRASVDLKNLSCREMRVVDDKLVALIGESLGVTKQLVCYSPQGELLWSEEQCVDFAQLGEDNLLVLRNAGTPSTVTLSFRDISTGDKLQEDVTVTDASLMTPFGFYQEAFAADSVVTMDVQSLGEKYIYLYDPVSGGVEVLDPFAQWASDKRSSLRLHAAAVLDSGAVLAMVGDGSGGMNGQYNNMVTTSPANAEVLCFRKGDWSLSWRQPIRSYSYSTLRTIQSIPGSDRILCQKDNAFYILDGATGQILAQCEAQANVSVLYVQEDRTVGILENGSYFLYDYADNECYALQLMDADIQQAQMVGVYYTLTGNSTHITKYAQSPQTQWTTYKSAEEGYARWELLLGDRMVTQDSQKKLQVIDLRTDSCLWAGAVNDAYSTTLLGLSEDEKTLYLRERNDIRAYAMDSGEVQTLPIPKSVNGSNADICGFGYGGQERYYYLLRLESDLYFAVMALQTGEAQIYPFLQNLEGSSWEIGSTSGIVAANADYAWAWQAGTLYEITLQDGSCRALLTELAEYPLCIYHEAEGLLSVGTGNALLFFQPGGAQTMAFSLGEQKAASLCFHDGQLLVVSNERQLLRFAMDGTRLSQTELQVYTNFYLDCVPTEGEQMDIGWDFTDKGDLIVNVFGMGNIVDCTQWEVRAYLPQYIGYDAEADRLICYIESEYGYFPRCTTAQVMQLAREQLGSFRLSDDLKADYGIK